MQARFLLGPAGNGKTFHCLEEVRAALAAPKQSEGGLKQNSESELIFLAPKQATFQLERQLLAGTACCAVRPALPKSDESRSSQRDDPTSNQIQGFTRLHILSFERLARFVFEKLNIAPPQLLSDEGRVMVLRALLLQHKKELKLFSKSAHRPGFANQLSQLLRELQQHQITPEKLRSLAQSKNLRAELRDKLTDLALLHENYSGWLNENKLQDVNCLLDFAAERLRQSTIHDSRFTIHHLWLDGFAEMTPQELDLLAAVIPFCQNATLAFCLDQSSAGVSPANSDAAGTAALHSWLSIWNGVAKTFQRCRQRIENLPNVKIEIEFLKRDLKRSRFAKNSALQLLEQNWQTVEVGTARCAVRTPQRGVPTIWSCANPEAEAIFAARQILKFVRKGNRFRDCAVIVRNLENYHKPFARVFRRYGIPFFLDRRESVAHHPLAELTRSALRTIAFDWKNDDWFAALKSGFCSVEENEIDALENAALEFGWRGKKWREPLQIPNKPELAQSFERIRRQILPPFENFYERFSKLNFNPNGKQLAEFLRELWDDLRAEKTLEKWRDELFAAGSTIQQFNDSTHSSVFEQMNSLLENLELGFPNQSLPLRDWLPILEAGLANLTIGVIPPVLDEVLIGAIDRARNPDLKFTLVLGVNESVFPATPNAPAILTEADRDELQIPLGPDLREQISRENFYGYLACTRASEKLALAFSRNDADGKFLNPSPFIAQLRQIFPALEIEEFQNEIDLLEVESTNEIVPFVLKIYAPHPGPLPVWRGEGGRRPDEGSNILDELLELPSLIELKKNLGELREPNPQENLSPEIAAKLYEIPFRTSVSRLEEFASCPFRFFVRSGLRAEERKIFELDARERGSFQHDVLKMFHEQIIGEGKHWRDLTPDEARERIGKIAGELTGNFRGGLLSETAQSRFTARAMTESLQNFVAVSITWLREQNQFDPVAAELDFGSKKSPETAWEIDLQNGRKLALTGRIDRVDLCRSENGGAQAIVLDYKSSQKKLDAIFVAHGIQLQLLAYLNVLRHWKNPRGIFGVDQLNPAGVFYVNLRGQFENGSREEILTGADEARKTAYQHNGRFDASVLVKLDSKCARDQFNYRLKNNGELYASSIEALPGAKFETLLDGVETQLREFGNAIFSGVANVDPYKKGTQTPCEFCDYQAACRIDKWTHQWRVLRAEKTTETV